MRLRVPALVTSGLLVLVVAGCGGSGGSAVVTVSISPWPEGPIGPVAATKPVPGIYVPLAEIEDTIPKMLPDNPRQRCSFGATVEVTLANGRTLMSRSSACGNGATITAARSRRCSRAQRATRSP
jgi:hypothetical protein